jgi:MFS family permease
MTQIGAGALLPVLAPFVEARLGATPTQAMLIVAAFYAAQFLAAPTIGKVADRRGASRSSFCVSSVPSSRMRASSRRSGWGRS